MERVVITGVGPVSAIGSGRNAFWEALLAGQHGLGPITLCDVSSSPSKIGAEVRGFGLERFVENGDVLGQRTPRPIQLALAAAVLALHDAELDLDATEPDRLGVYVGTSVGTIGDTLAMRDRWRETGEVPPHAAFHTFPHAAACILSSFFNIRGPVHTVTQGCNSGLDAVGMATRAIQTGTVDAVLVVGTDCELLPEVMAVLNASGSLATKFNDEPGIASRPFDRRRDGNVIGEGAAAVLLEGESHASARDARVYARVAGYQMCSAGRNRQYSHDNPELDTRPCGRAVRGAMAEAGWSPSQVDVFNANGSSSVKYDRLEGQALVEVFGDHLRELRVHSIKSMLGQHGAGSSALQVVATCLGLRRAAVPPTINHEEPDPDGAPLRVVTQTEDLAHQRVLVHAIGLGGFYYSALALEAIPESAATGTGQVVWSRDGHPHFRPLEPYQRPLEPWAPHTA